MMKVKLNLSPLEREILNHRLEVPDAIGSCLEETHPEFDDVLGDIIAMLHRGEWQEAFSLNADAAREVLWDAVDGSTYYGAGKNELSQQRNAAIARAGRSLATKVSALIGRPVRFPEH